MCVCVLQLASRMRLESCRTRALFRSRPRPKRATRRDGKEWGEAVHCTTMPLSSLPQTLRGRIRASRASAC